MTNAPKTNAESAGENTRTTMSRAAAQAARKQAMAKAKEIRSGLNPNGAWPFPVAQS